MPLTFDLPLEQLKNYTGTNPRPADFDTYWGCALDEMHAIDPNIEMVPARFHAPDVEFFHLYFTGVGGARVHAKVVRPAKASQPHPAVLMFHGYTYDSGDWSSKLVYAG